MKNNIIYLLLLVITLNSCQNEEKDSFDLLITNVKIIDVKANSINDARYIAINGDTIAKVGSMESVKDLQAMDTLDAENKFAMPGLWDMHVHFRGGDSLVEENKDLLPLFLAYGVTTVRDAGGDITSSVLEWRQKIEEGKLAGPRIFTSGPKLDGKNPAWEGSLKVNNEKEIQEALDSLKALNVDYVKMYDGSLTPEVYYGIIKEAESRNLKTTGHMPLQASFRKGIDLGLDGIEHMYYPVKASSDLADSLSNTNFGYGMMSSFIDTYNSEKAAELFKKMAAEEVSVTPTLHIGKVLANILETDHSEDYLLAFVGEGIQKTYQRRIEGAKRAKASGNTMREKMEDLSKSMIVPMYEAGVNIFAGSDSGAFNSFVYSGESLHSELEELVNAGLTPAQALETSIINGPRFFHLSESYGSLEEGKTADLILLKKNPLEEIKNTRTIEYVIRNNKVYTPGELLKKIRN